MAAQRRAGMMSGISTAISPVSQEEFLQNSTSSEFSLKFAEHVENAISVTHSSPRAGVSLHRATSGSEVVIQLQFKNAASRNRIKRISESKSSRQSQCNAQRLGKLCD
jgi:RNase P protein component